MAAAIRPPAPRDARTRRRSAAEASAPHARPPRPPVLRRRFRSARRTIAQRPPLSMAKGSTRPRRFAPARGFRWPDGASRPRSPAKLSEVTSPSATSSASATSTSDRNRRAATTSSSKNKAPCARRQSSTTWARGLGPAAPFAGASDIHSPACLRSSRAMGVAPTADTGDARSAAPAGGVRRAQTRPPGETLSVEPRRLVVLEAGRQDLGFPRPRGRLEPFHLSQNDRERLRPLQTRLFVNMLPGEQEAEKIARGDGVDLRAQAPDRVTVDAGQQAAVAPLLVVGARNEAPSQDCAFRPPTPPARRSQRAGSSPSGAVSAVWVTGPRSLQPAAQDFDQRLLLRPLRLRPDRPGAQSPAEARAFGQRAWN